MKKNRIPDLYEIAFEGRYKDYGAYVIRKKYKKYLLFSMITAIFLFLVIFIAPLAWYYFQDPVSTSEFEDIISVEYAYIPPPEDISLIIRGTPPPFTQMEIVKLPVVVDTVIEKKKDIPPLEKEFAEEKTSDSARDSSLASGSGNEGTGKEGNLYSTLDVFPRFPGGDQARLMFLRQNIRYPQQALKEKIQGVVKVVFVIEPDGSLSKFDIVKGVGGGCDEEALRVAKLMPRWEPGRRHGRPVRVLMSMPIVFRMPVKPGK